MDSIYSRSTGQARDRDVSGDSEKSSGKRPGCCDQLHHTVLVGLGYNIP